MPTTPVGNEFRANTFTELEQIDPKVAIDSNGNSLVVWTSHKQLSEADSFDIFGQRYDPSGAEIGDEFLINTYTSFSQKVFDIAMEPNGDFVVVWNSVKHPTDDNSVYAQRFNADGSPAGNEFHVANVGVGNSTDHFPAVSLDGNGDLVVAWYDFVEDHLGNIQNLIHARMFNKNGSPKGDDIEVTSIDLGSTPADGGFPDITARPDGGFIVTWHRREFPGLVRLYAQVFDSNGTKVGGEIDVNNLLPIRTSEFSSVDVDGNGNFIVTWHSLDQDPVATSADIYARRFSANGTSLGNAFRVNQNLTSSQINPAISVKDSGGFTVAWESHNQDGDSWGIYARNFFADGTPDGDEYLVNSTTASNQLSPALALNNDGDALIAWKSNHVDPTFHDWNVYAQRFQTSSDSSQPTNGDDYIVGTSGDDTISALDGNDTVFGVAGDDVLYGNQGADSISGGSGNDTLYGNEGDDTLEGNSQNDTQFGGSGNDRLIDTHGHDFLDGGEGDDTLTSGEGSDTLLGGDGNDSLEGGSGNDYLEGNDGNDTLHGGSSSDEIIGGLGNDSLTGHTGLDTLVGGDGNDTLRGGGGADLLTGGLGRDVMNGEGGADTFFFTTPQDSLKINPDRITGHDYADIFDVSALGYTALEFDSTGSTSNTEADVLRYYHSVTDSGEQRTYVVDDVDVFGFYVVGHLNFSSNDFTLA